MSLDVYLDYPKDPTEQERAVKLLRQNGFDNVANRLERQSDPDKKEVVYEANITHNLSSMADEAGIYRHLWRPEEIGISKAGQLIEPLRKGLSLMRAEPDRFKRHNSPNGWGLYEHFVPWVERYLSACEEHPEAVVSVSR